MHEVNRREVIAIEGKHYGVHSSNSAATNTTNLTAALAALPSGRGGEVILDKSDTDYSFSTLPTLASGQVIAGRGMRNTRLKITSLTEHGIKITGSASPTTVQTGLRDLALIGPGKSSGGTGDGLHIVYGTYGLTFERLWLTAWGRHGAYAENTYTASWRDCLFDGNGGDGYHGLTNINQTLLERCVAISNGGAGYQIVGGAGNVLLACDAESNGTYGADLRYCYSTMVLGGDYESNTSANIYVHYASSLSDKSQCVGIVGVNLTGASVTPIGILIDGANGTYYQGCTFNNHTTDHVQCTNKSTWTWVGFNLYAGTGTVLTDNSTGSTMGVDQDQSKIAVRTRGKHYITGEVEIDGALNHDGTTVGFYGVAPATQPAALTAANAGTLNTGDATSDTVIGNMRTRIGELETKLQSLGLIS